jgi:dolichyl-phosphate-mannose-protein mannosyltransferase
MRFIPALSSAMLVPVTYWTCRELGVTWWGSLVCGSMVLFDNLSVTEGRVLTTDTSLLVFLALTLMFYLRTSNMRVHSDSWYWNLFLTGVFMAMTISTKWIALNVVGVVGVFTALDVLIRGTLGFSIKDGFVPERMDLTDFFVRLFFLLVMPFMFYVFNFYMWIATTPKWGEFGPAHMPLSFQSRLEGSMVQSNEPQMSFWETFVFMNTAMFTGNRDVGKGVKGHPWESWW